MKQNSQLSPHRIREIRESLGLTQAEAGKVLGGGPQAFTKYESGNQKPSAAMRNLLRVLEVDPDALWIHTREHAASKGHVAPSPFDVAACTITQLSSEGFTELLRRILNAEAHVHGLPFDGIHVASNIHAPDGGEDGRISWRGDPARTRFLPSRLCQFQLKAGKIDPARAGREVITKVGEVKLMVRKVLEQGGHYILLCAWPYTQQEIEARRQRICDALTNAGIVDADPRVHVRSAEQIATWVNFYLSVALWVREEVGLESFDGFVTWSQWKGRSEHSLPWIKDPRLDKLYPRLQNTVTRPGTVLRVVGLSGIGKSRLCLEALGRDAAHGHSVRDLVMYAVQSETGAEKISSVTQRLAISGSRAILVVDNCDAQTHDILSRTVAHSNSQLSLVTIDHEIPSHINASTHRINEAPTSVVEGVVNQMARDLRYVDHSRLAHMSRGFPAVAIRIAREFSVRGGSIHPAEDSLIKRYVCPRDSTDQELLLKSAQLLAVFGPVKIEPAGNGYPDDGRKVIVEDHLGVIADLGRQLTRDDLYAGAQRLAEHGVVKQWGGLVTVEPRPIAMRLAERQWKEWVKKKWDRVFSGAIGFELAVSAAQQLSKLNNREIANRVAVHVCRSDGPLDRFNSNSDVGHAAILSAFAEVHQRAVAERLDSLLTRIGYAPSRNTTMHCDLAVAASKIAFHTNTFEIGARLLLRMSIMAGKLGASDASRQFVALFPAELGGTEADGNARLRFLDEAVDTCDLAQLNHIVTALVTGCEIVSYTRSFGPEIQGSRKTLDSWCPASNRERADYIAGCAKRLGKLAARSDSVGIKTRSAFGGSIRPLVCNGFLYVVEDVVQRVASTGCIWASALQHLKALQTDYSSHYGEDSPTRVQSLIDKLEPTNLPGRVRLYLIELPMVGIMDEGLPMSEQIERQCVNIRLMANELLREPRTLKEILPELSTGRQRRAAELGESFAVQASSPLELLEIIVEAAEHVPNSERNFDLLAGFVAGLPETFHEEREAFKRKSAVSAKLAPAFPRICQFAGLTPTDVDLAVDALRSGHLSPWLLHHWCHTEVLGNVGPSKVARLIDVMLEHGAPSFILAVRILGRIVDSDQWRAEQEPPTLQIAQFQPQALRMIKNAGRWSWKEIRHGSRPAESDVDQGMTDDYFEQIALWLLNKGPGDSTANATAFALAQTLAHGDRHNWLNPNDIERVHVLRRLLAGFPETVWPLVGSTIVANPSFANRMTYVMGQPDTFDRSRMPPILDLPEDVLFAWCRDNPDGAPAFAAMCVPFLATEGGNSLHPVTHRLLDEFGKRKDVRQALERRIHYYSWDGGLERYYERFQKPLERLREHPIPTVRQWAEKMRAQVEHYITRETMRSGEREARASVR